MFAGRERPPVGWQGRRWIASCALLRAVVLLLVGAEGLRRRVDRDCAHLFQMPPWPPKAGAGWLAALASGWVAPAASGRLARGNPAVACSRALQSEFASSRTGTCAGMTPDIAYVCVSGARLAERPLIN